MRAPIDPSFSHSSSRRSSDSAALPRSSFDLLLLRRRQLRGLIQIGYRNQEHYRNQKHYHKPAPREKMQNQMKDSSYDYRLYQRQQSVYAQNKENFYAAANTTANNVPAPPPPAPYFASPQYPNSGRPADPQAHGHSPYAQNQPAALQQSPQQSAYYQVNHYHETANRNASGYLQPAPSNGLRSQVPAQPQHPNVTYYTEQNGRYDHASQPRGQSYNQSPLSNNTTALNHHPYQQQQPLTQVSRPYSGYAPTGPVVHQHAATSHANPPYNVYQRSPALTSGAEAYSHGGGQQEQRNAKSRDQVLRALFMEKQIDLSHARKLGAGRYSKVITAIFLTDNRKIAIKMINTAKVTEEFRTKFLPREISCWKSLKHPYLVRILGHYEAMGHVFLSMEFGEGGDLLQFVQKSGPVEGHKAGMWMSQVVSGITYMAERSIAHRDLKLENIIIFNENTIKIADFGFARNVSYNDLSTTYCGSKSYSAPEILLGQPYDPFKADVWSVGVIGFVMVTDCMPFRENQPNAKIVESQRNRAYSFPSKLKITDDVQLSINMMLTFSWQQRPDIYDCARLPWIQPHVGPTKALIEDFNRKNPQA